MKYLVIGAGGTGGCIGGYLARAGKDVTLIARGAHLEAIQRDGIRINRPEDSFTTPAKATDMDSYQDTPDVIFVCVKGYSLNQAIAFIKRVATPDTLVIPVLNIYGTGAKMQQQLPNMLVTDGCIYIASEIEAPGTILMKGMVFRVVFGVRDAKDYTPKLEAVDADLKAAGIVSLLTDNIQRDALKKFSYVSPAATCGQFYDADAGPMQEPGEIRDTFAALIHEIEILAEAMGLDFGEDMVATNLAILDSLAPNAGTSMQRDIRAGKDSEIDGLVYEPVRMADRLGIDLPTYRRLAKALGMTE